MSISIQTTKDGVELSAFWDGYEHRFLGRIQTDTPKLAFPAFSDFLDSNSAPVLDPAKIPDYDRYQKNVPILDQNGLGACCGHSYTTFVMKSRDLAGYALELLSADSLYAQVNGGHDGGSDPADVITALEQNGICLLSDVPDRWVLWKNISSEAKQTALRFRIPAVGVYNISNFAELVTADYMGFSTAFTIRVGNNFGPDNNYVVGFSRGYSNHCVAGGESKRTVNGVPQFRFRNSWGQWGINGCAYILAESVDSQDGLESHALMWTLIDPLDPTNSPVVLS